MKEDDKVYSESYLNYQLDRGIIRKTVRKLFLKNLFKHIEGKSIDLGCGVGELLKLTERGSVGYEVNDYAVKYCRSQGLKVREYNPVKDNYRLADLKRNVYKTLIMCHVLEHLVNPQNVIRKLVKTCTRLNINKFIVVVPCKKGFGSDASHRVYVDIKYLRDNRLEKVGNYVISEKSYFPFNFVWAGNLFAFNELIVVYAKKS